MAQIPPIDDAYINEIIKSNGPYNPALLTTQGLKMRELIKWLRDRLEQGDTEAVHKIGDESISGTKTFTVIKAGGLSVNNPSNPSFDTVISPVTGVQTKLLNITEGTFSLQLSASVLAASRSQLLQDKDGVVALTSDLSSLEEQLNTRLDLKIDIDQRGAPGGVSTLDSGGKILASQLPDSISGALNYQGTWDATTNSPMLADPPASFTKGYYYVTNVAGAQFGLTFAVGDWVVSNGTEWQKVDNTDAVATVFGRLGNILANEGDYSAFYPLLSGSYADPSWITSLDYSKISNTPTTLSGFGITNAYTKTESDGRYPLKAGTGATGTWPIAISGNAATATTTTFWSTYTLQTSPITSMDFAFARNSSNIMAPIGSAGFKTWLGIPSAGETLQSVTDRGKTTTNTVQLGSLSSVQGTTTNSVLLLNTTTSNTGNRNWSIANGKAAIGDLAISQSNIAGGNGYVASESTIRLYFNQAGDANFSGSLGIGAIADPTVSLQATGITRLKNAGSALQLYSVNAIGSIYQSYHNNAGTRLGYVGFGSSVNNNLYILNDNGENVYNATKHTFNSEIIGTSATFSGNVVASQASVITGSPATIRSLQIRTGGFNRWLMYADAGAESGSNTGSNFNIARYSDAGAFLSNALIIDRASGATTFSGSVSVTTAPVNPTDVVRLSDLSSNSASSGTYTPTYTGITPTVIFPCYYTRIGDMVTVTGQVAFGKIDGFNRFDMTLPFATNIQTDSDIMGVTSSTDSNYSWGNVYGNTANDTAKITVVFTSVGSSSSPTSFMFTYLVK